jgi:integrase/recombinase XerC/integrase/recombinase XerD
LNLEEQARLIEAVRSSGVVRDLAVIGVLLSTGIGNVELCALTWESVVIRGDMGTLVLDRPRATNAIRIELSREAADALKCLRQSRRGATKQWIAVFVGRSDRITRRLIELLVDGYAHLAGLEDVTPITLRHTFVVNELNGGRHPIDFAQVIYDPKVWTWSARGCPAIQVKKHQEV